MKAVKVLLGVMALVFAGFMTVGLYLAHTPDGQQRIAERAAIERCRAAQDDALQELATRRLMRQGCDMMEADYRAKWGVGP